MTKLLALLTNIFKLHNIKLEKGYKENLAHIKVSASTKAEVVLRKMGFSIINKLNGIVADKGNMRLQFTEVHENEDVETLNTRRRTQGVSIEVMDVTPQLLQLLQMFKESDLQFSEMRHLGNIQRRGYEFYIHDLKPLYECLRKEYNFTNVQKNEIFDLLNPDVVHNLESSFVQQLLSKNKDKSMYFNHITFEIDPNMAQLSVWL